MWHSGHLRQQKSMAQIRPTAFLEQKVFLLFSIIMNFLLIYFNRNRKDSYYRRFGRKYSLIQKYPLKVYQDIPS